MQGYPPTETLIETTGTTPVSNCEPHRRENVFSRGGRLFLKLRDYCDVLGIRAGLRWFLKRAFVRLFPGKGGHVTSIRPPVLNHPVRVRMFPHSDEYVFDQVFIQREHAPLVEMEEPRFILDLGANVGYTSALFASRYPDARILAVEPDPGNFRMCVENLRPYGDRVKILLGAVWGHSSRLTLERGGGDGRDWAIQVHEASDQGEAQVEAWDVPALLTLAGEESMDLAKIDIEGSEAEVFSGNTDWLSRTRNICIELHGPHCEEIFFRALGGYDYKRIHHGENTLCLNVRRGQAQGV